MAHMICIEELCFCGKKATHEVFNWRNAPQGKFCKRHAEKRLAEIKAIEEEK